MLSLHSGCLHLCPCCMEAWGWGRRGGAGAAAFSRKEGHLSQPHAVQTSSEQLHHGHLALRAVSPCRPMA